MRPRTSGDRGVSAIIVALMLTALLGVSSLAVDVGSAYNERRHDQNTVDAAAMSAMVEAVIGGGSIADIVAEVREKVDITLGRTVSASEWSSCSDPDQLEYTTAELQAGDPSSTIAPLTDCISFSKTFGRVRVKLPQQEAISVFGKALGFGSLETSAAAEAAIESPGGIGAPPFVALSTATQGDFVCLRTSDNPQPPKLLDGMGPGNPPVAGNRADPCDKSAYDTSNENYGTLQPYRYTDGCKQQNSDVEVGISLGIDHPMGFFPNGYDPTSSDPTKSTERIDGGKNCMVQFPNTFYVDTGFNAQGLQCALISLDGGLCNGVVPRLHQGNEVQSTYTFAGERMDNSTPWEFLRKADDLYAEGAPDECVFVAASRADDSFAYSAVTPSTESIRHYQVPTSYDVYGVPQTFQEQDMTLVDDSDWDHYDRYDALTQCLEKWDPYTDPVLFTEGIADSPRFAFIPKVAESGLYKVSKVHIESFLPSFMYRLYQAKNSGDTPCDPIDPRASTNFYVHDAGQQFSCGKTTANVDRLSSIMLACGMVPATLCDKKTGEPDFGGQDINDYRLVK